MNIARAALRQASLDRLLFVVAGTPPHKRHATTASPEDRFALVEAAVADEPQMEPSRIELDRPGPSFTVDTLALLQEQFPGVELYLVLGMDALIDLPKWRSPERIVSLAQLLVVPRPGEWKVPDSMTGRYAMLDFSETEVSSTEIRRRIVAGESLDEFLPDAVSRLIRERGIYRGWPPDAGGENAGA